MSKEQVVALTDAMQHGPQVSLDMQHHLINGIYARTAFLPAGTLGTGCEHKTDHMSILVGDASLTLEDKVTRVTGYNVLPTKKGMMRAIFAHSDCWLTTIIRTRSTELLDIENEAVEKAETLQTQNPRLCVSKQLLGA